MDVSPVVAELVGAPPGAAVPPAPVVVPRCRLVGGAFAVLVQVFLFSVVVCTLYLKWMFERPRRPRTLWLFDSARQAIGAGTGHILNIVLAMVLSGMVSDANECAWYFLSQSLDTVVGVPVMFLVLRTYERTLGRELPRSGDYYVASAKRIDFATWVRQVVTWVLIVLLTKSLLFLPLIEFNAPLSSAMTGLFKPLDKSPKGSLVFVMVVWPALCNSVQFYVIDGFLKKPLGSGDAGENAALLT